jgi:RND family efflux transporter MFP subunit
VRRSVTLLVLLALLSACGGTSNNDRGQGPDPSALDTVTVTRTVAPRERAWDGVIEAVHQATLSAQTAGRIVELPFDVNDYVASGEVVVRFTDVEQQAAVRRADAATNAAQAAVTESEADLARIRTLVEEGVVARAQLDQVVARRDSAVAQLDSAHAALRTAREQLEYTVIRAPYSGILTERYVEIGESVQPGQPLVSGLSLDRLRVNVHVPQSDILAIRAFGRAAVLLDDGARVDAAQVTVFPYADPATHSFRVRVELPEVETGLHPGMTVKVAFVLGETDRLLVPVSALVRRSEVTAVYVIDAGRLVLRQIRLGHRFGDHYEVLAGLDDGAVIARDPVAAGILLATR